MLKKIEKITKMISIGQTIEIILIDVNHLLLINKLVNQETKITKTITDLKKTLIEEILTETLTETIKGKTVTQKAEISIISKTKIEKIANLSVKAYTKTTIKSKLKTKIKTVQISTQDHHS